MHWEPFEQLEDVHSPLGPLMDPGHDMTVWANNWYVVVKRVLEDGCVWLSIRSEPGAPLHDWRHFQKIKNELVGPEIEAIEMYPAESRLVDTSNQFHLWCLPPGKKIPFGFDERLVTEAEIETTKQRKFEECVRPADLVPPDVMRDRLQRRASDETGRR